MKLIKLLIVVLMLLGLVGCESNDSNSLKPSNGNVDNLIEESSNFNEAENLIEKLPDVKETQISMGEWSGFKYTNDYLNITYNMPHGWISANEEEIKELMNIGAEVVFGEDDFMKKIAEMNSVYYMYTQKPLTGENVQIMSEKPFLDISIDTYIDALKQQFLKVDNLKYEIKEVSTDFICGEEYTTLTATVQNYNILQKMFVRKQDKRFISIIITTTNGEDALNEIMNCFE